MRRYDCLNIPPSLFAKWMQDCAEEISRGERKGVTVIYSKPHPKVKIGWLERIKRLDGFGRKRA